MCSKPAGTAPPSRLMMIDRTESMTNMRRNNSLRRAGLMLVDGATIELPSMCRDAGEGAEAMPAKCYHPSPRWLVDEFPPPPSRSLLDEMLYSSTVVGVGWLLRGSGPF